MKNNVTITTEPIKSNIDFDFYLEFLNDSCYHSKIYEIYLRFNTNYIKFGKCYIRREDVWAFADPVKVFPYLSSYYTKVNNLQEDVTTKIAKKIETIICEKIK